MDRNGWAEEKANEACVFGVWSSGDETVDHIGGSSTSDRNRLTEAGGAGIEVGKAQDETSQAGSDATDCKSGGSVCGEDGGCRL